MKKTTTQKKDQLVTLGEFLRSKKVKDLTMQYFKSFSTTIDRALSSDDLFQESAIKLLKYTRDYPDRFPLIASMSRFESIFIDIFRKICIDQYRKEKSHRKRCADFTRQTKKVDVMINYEANRVFEQHEKGYEAKLTEKQKIVLDLRFQDLPPRKISDLLDTEVKIICNEVRQLKRKYEKYTNKVTPFLYSTLESLDSIHSIAFHSL